MSKVFIDWNMEYYAQERENTTSYSKEDVTIHENGWVSIQQDSDTIIHYPPQRINKIVVKEN